MTKTPGNGPAAPPDSELIEELSDDAIIAQQAAAHAPAPRAQVDQETRSIVVTEEPRREGQPTRRLAAYGAASSEPTVVIRDRKLIESLNAKPVKRTTMSPTVRAIVWGGAGIAAFAAGGLIAVLTTRRPRPPQPEMNGGAPSAVVAAAPVVITPPHAETGAAPEPTSLDGSGPTDAASQPDSAWPDAAPADAAPVVKPAPKRSAARKRAAPAATESAEEPAEPSEPAKPEPAPAELQ